MKNKWSLILYTIFASFLLLPSQSPCPTEFTTSSESMMQPAQVPQTLELSKVTSSYRFKSIHVVFGSIQWMICDFEMKDHTGVITLEVLAGRGFRFSPSAPAPLKNIQKWQTANQLMVLYKWYWMLRDVHFEIHNIHNHPYFFKNSHNPQNAF